MGRWSMSATLHLLLLMGCGCGLTHSRAMVMVSPPWLQFARYDNFTLSCEHFAVGDGRVWRYTGVNKQLSRCGQGWGLERSSVCHMSTVLAPDSGVYWCQCELGGESSDAIRITITNGDVTLRSPTHPVTEGDQISLRCHSKSRSSDLPAEFYKDDALLRTEESGHMTLDGASMSDKGAYTCSIKGQGKSPSSLLQVAGDAVPVSLTVSPDSSQHYEYTELTMNCSNGSAIVRRFPTKDHQNVQTCGEGKSWGESHGSDCVIKWAKKPDSGIYWCETPSLQRSNFVSITFYDGDVILQSPTHPVMEGDNVTLTCQSKRLSPATAEFYNGNTRIGIERLGNMTLRHLSKSAEGFYWCRIDGQRSPSSWLSVRASPSTQTKPSSPLWIIRSLVVTVPYCIATVLMLSERRRRPSAGKKSHVSRATPHPDDTAEGVGPDYDDVTTEHSF